MLVALRPGGASPSTMLSVAKRPLNSTAATPFQMIDTANQSVRELTEDRIVVTGINSVDGQYVVLVTPPKNGQ
jgi:hypothetical protein